MQNPNAIDGGRAHPIGQLSWCFQRKGNFGTSNEKTGTGSGNEKTGTGSGKDKTAAEGNEKSES
jgi:hypothetical protein